MVWSDPIPAPFPVDPIPGFKFPFAMMGFAQMSLVGGGSAAGQLSAKYDWGEGTKKYDGQIKVVFFGGLRAGAEYGISFFDVGVSVFAEGGVKIGNYYSFSESKLDEWKAGWYIRGVAEYEMGKDHLQRYQYNEERGGYSEIF